MKPDLKLADRWFHNDEQDEQVLIDMMKDVDEMLEISREFYPNNTWSRHEIMQLLQYRTINSIYGEILNAK